MSNLKAGESPRIVFVPDVSMPYNTVTFAKFNADDKKRKSPIEKAVEASKTISPQIVTLLSNLIGESEIL